ncbi:fumarylacetoacetate hydrolase family protein [Nocardia fusca]|uniref:fumarylacetoacetate hydrolase family protein n=1 Tax=Nocardia fusca TaxID=941183 RepID=UPI0037C6EC2F
MIFANQAGRFVIVIGSNVVDVHESSGGKFGPDPAQVFSCWSEFLEWASSATTHEATDVLDERQLGAPSPTPRQVFGIGANYRRHAEEAGWPLPEVPLTFTKFSSSVTGPCGEIELSGPRVDWEVETVVVIGKSARKVSADEAWNYVAGITLGQDLSDRDIQNLPTVYPQFSLGKSLPRFAPIGPVLVTPDSFADRNSIEIACSLNGQEVQRDRTSDLIFDVGELIAYLSGIVTLLPGDLIFTGTPSGVGVTMDPPRFLMAGDELVTTAPEIGTMHHRFVAVEDAVKS